GRRAAGRQARRAKARGRPGAALLGSVRPPRRRDRDRSSRAPLAVAPSPGLVAPGSQSLRCGPSVEGREEEFLALIERYARVVASAIRRVCGRQYKTLVPDVEQDVHAALWAVVKSGKKIEHPSSYLYKVALTTALAAVRRSMPEMTTITIDED